MRWLAIAIFALVLVSGCTKYENYYTWNLPVGGTQQQSDADWYQCQRENTARGTVIDPGIGAAGNTTVTPTATVNEEMALQCMRARGYTVTGKQQRAVQ